MLLQFQMTDFHRHSKTKVTMSKIKLYYTASIQFSLKNYKVQDLPSNGIVRVLDKNKLNFLPEKTKDLSSDRRALMVLGVKDSDGWKRLVR